MNEETKLPDGLELAENLCSHAWHVGGCSTDRLEFAVSAIRTEHSQRMTLQHHCADLAQRVADLGGELETERMRLAACGVIAMSDTPESAEKARQMLPIYESASASDVARRVDECMALRAKVAELEAERDTARGAVRELEHKVFSQGQALDVLRACVARHQRDELDPPGYLQDAVIRAAGLGLGGVKE